MSLLKDVIKKTCTKFGYNVERFKSSDEDVQIKLRGDIVGREEVTNNPLYNSIFPKENLAQYHYIQPKAVTPWDPRMQQLVFPRIGFLYSQVLPKADYSPWNTNEEFFADYAPAIDHTMKDIYRCYDLWCLTQECFKTSNFDILEVGVWKGGSGVMLAKLAQKISPQSKVYLCDTFTGVVKADKSIDVGYEGGEHADTSKDYVKSLADKLKLNNVHLLQGIFPEDTGKFVENCKFSLIHIDVDVYYSAKDIFSWCWDKLAVGGAVVFDDYGFLGCNGIPRLIEEIKNDSKYKNGFITTNLNGHAVIVKFSETVSN